MNRSTPFRIVVAVASTCITLALFASVASLADDRHDQASTQSASLLSTAPHEVRKLLRAHPPRGGLDSFAAMSAPRLAERNCG